MAAREFQSAGAPPHFTGTWQATHGRYALLHHSDTYIEVCNDQWPAIATWDGTYLTIWWRCHVGQYELVDGEFHGGWVRSIDAVMDDGTLMNPVSRDEIRRVR